jgi:hypothetical protein
MSIKCWSQETFFDILERLNVHDDVEVTYNFKNSIINQDSSFFIKKNPLSCCGLKYVLLNKNEKFSAFGVFDTDEFSTASDNMFMPYSHIVIFDKLRNRNFVIEYGFLSYTVVINKKNKTLKLFESSFGTNLSRITEVNSNFVPIWNLRIDYIYGETVSRNENPLYSIEKYTLINNSWYKKIKIFKIRVPFKTLLYQEFLDFDDESFDESIPVKCNKNDNLPMYRFVKIG